MGSLTGQWSARYTQGISFPTSPMVEVSHSPLAQLIKHGFLLTRSLATTLLVEGARTSPSLGVIVGPVGVGSGAPPKVAKASTLFSNTSLISVGGVPSASTTSTGVAMTPAAKIAAKRYEKIILACILNQRGVEDRDRLRKWMLKRLIDSQIS